MKKFLLASLCLFSVSTFGQECTTWGCTSVISDLYTNADGAIYVGTYGDEKKANCTAVSGVYFTLDSSSSNAKEVYSSMLAAFMSGKKIQLRIKEGHAKCELAYVRLSTSH
ncbi:hypothetical protein VINI7043_12466 [Vibrio nigripulchritudo ATCC 27043]|uniref:hypothetical protein n=1 Tax=Vibrio nigripulchritudo TaxID=28173 RepID=UPI00021C41DE|nr:hypothetical protein [Vibrio nigripulchritudo]EGU57979.1 hypothetical protein VINI7043_12466 [Vibrio nigripulchritudo ATCC 27043]